MDEDRNKLINTEQLIGRALDKGVDLGSKPHKTVNKYIELGIVPKLINGTHPAAAVYRLVAIDKLIKDGKTLEEVQEIIKKERKAFLDQAEDLNSLVSIYKKASFRSLLMLVSLTIIMIFSYSILTAQTPATFAGEIVKQAVKPVGKTLALIIRQAKDEGSSASTDPLGLTNISDIIKVNEKQEIVFEKNIASPKEISATNFNADKVDNADAGTDAGDVLLLDELGNIDILGDIIATSFTGSGEGLTNLPASAVTGVLANASIPTDIAANKILGVLTNSSIGWSSVTSKPTLLTSIDGVSNNLGNINFIAGAGITITPNNTSNTITFNLAGSGVNADLLDGLDSLRFLRSDTSDSFTSGILTIAGGTTLSVLGTFSCTNCVGDSAIPDTITASNYLLLAGDTMAGALNMGNNLITNIGGAGTDFTAGGGLNIATDLDVEGHGAFGSGAGALGDRILNITGTESGESIFRGITVTATSSYNIVGRPDVFGIRSIGEYTGTIASADIYGIEALGMYSPTSGGGSATNVVGLSSFFSTILASVGSVTNGYGIQVKNPTIGTIDPTNIYGIRINNQGNASTTNTYGLYIDDQTGSINNYGICFDCDGTFGTQTVASGIAWGNDGTAANNIHLFRSANGQSTLENGGGTDLWNASATQFQINLDNTTSYSERLCHGGSDAATGLVAISDCSGTPGDYAEIYGSSDTSLEAGDLVVVDPNRNAEIVSKDGKQGSKAFVLKSDSSYDHKLIGVVSTDPNEVIGQNFNASENPIPIALNGRVPVKVSSEGGSISAGDPLTSSSIPGVAMKATKSGPIIGKALGSYNDSGIGNILIFVSVGWYVAGVENNEVPGNTSIDTDTLSLNSLSTQILIVGHRQISMNELGALSIDGDVEINGDLVVFGRVTAEEISLGEDSSDIDTIKLGSKKKVISTTKVSEESKILVTFMGNYSPATRYWVSRQNGEGFTVHLDHEVSSDTKFSWLIVN